MIKRIALLGLFLLLFFCFPNISFANEREIVTFEDHFSTLDTTNWHYYDTNGGISVNNGLELTSENSKYFPFLYLNNNVIPSSGDYFIEVKYVFPTITNFGVGFGLGNAIPEYGIQNQSIPDSDFIQFQLWQGTNDGHLLQTNKCPQLGQCESNRTTLFQYPISSSEHVLRIEYRGSNFSIFIDGNEIINNSLLSIDRRPTYFWIGNNIRLLTNNNWTSLTIEYVKIGRIENIENPTILVPGLGASWDFNAILNGTEGNNWQIPDFVGVYKGLENSFINSGYIKDTNFFVFTYDWRKPLSQLAEQLKTFIDDRIPSGTKVNLVGHSMGGLVARSYAQTHLSDGKVNKLVMLGSPNDGAIKAYGVWEGATVWDDAWWGKVALAITTQLNKQIGESSVDTLRRVVPSILDLMPTEDYVNLNNSLVPVSEIKQQNTYLMSLNSNFGSVNDLTTTMASSEIQTPSEINAELPSLWDKVLNKWEDGKPVINTPFVYSDGDGTVTEASAFGPFTNNVNMVGGHSDLVTNVGNISTLFNSLGTDSSAVTAGDNDISDNVFTAILHSPGSLKVCNADYSLCDSNLGYLLDNGKLFLMKNYQDQKINVGVVPDGLDVGKYSLYLGRISDNEAWKKIDGDLGMWFSDNYSVLGKSLIVGSDTRTGKSNLWLAESNLEKYSANWDKRSRTNIIFDSNYNASDRYNAVVSTRKELEKEFKNAYKMDDLEYFSAVLDVWKNIDYMMDQIIGYSSVNTFVNFNAKSSDVSKLNIDIEKMKIRNMFQTILLDQANVDLSESAEMLETNFVKYDRLNSANRLIKVSQEINR